jgi:glutathione S-transferase
MTLALYGHPFSSYTQKTLVVLYENATPFEFRCVGPEHPEHTAEWRQRWPMHKFPVLVDGERQVAESSIINEYLQLTYPGAAPLIPADPLLAIEMRFVDRFFDLHVMDPVQQAVGAAIKGDAAGKDEAMAGAVERLGRAYAWLERNLPEATWSCGEDFTLADCSAAPALFYADWVHRIPEAFPKLRAYRARLLARPSFARAVDEARPYRPLFPLGAPDRD